MKNKVNVPCKFIQMLGMGISVIGLFSGAYGMVYEVPIFYAIGIVFTIMGIFVGVFFTGSCTAEDDGIAIRMPFREMQMIPYDDIDWVSLDVRRGTSTKGSPYYSLIYKIKIVTRTDTLILETSHGRTSTPSDLYDVKRKEFILMNSPFKDIERIIKQKKGMDLTSDIMSLSR